MLFSSPYSINLTDRKTTEAHECRFLLITGILTALSYSPKPAVPIGSILAPLNTTILFGTINIHCFWGMFTINLTYIPQGLSSLKGRSRAKSELYGYDRIRKIRMVKWPVRSRDHHKYNDVSV